MLGWLRLMLAEVKLGLEASLSTESKIVIDVIFLSLLIVVICVEVLILSRLLLWLRHRVRCLCLWGQNRSALLASLLLLASARRGHLGSDRRHHTWLHHAWLHHAWRHHTTIELLFSRVDVLASTEAWLALSHHGWCSVLGATLPHLFAHSWLRKGTSLCGSWER